MITIYTDGSSRGNPGPGGWGAIIVFKIDGKEFVREIGGGERHTTNNRMELTACIKALESLEPTTEKLEPIAIYTDSQYVCKGITEWIYTWQKNNWRTAGRKPVENQDLWQVLWHNVDGKDIKWKFVRGHNGTPGNERCDNIATAYADLPTGQAGGAGVDLYDGARSKYPIDLDTREA